MELNNVPVTAITPDQMEGIYDIVILMAKQTYNNVALPQLLPHLGPDSVVCTLQNGIPEESVGKIVGPERVVGGVVGWGASWLRPGVSELTSDISAMRFEIGESNGEITERIEQIASILRLAGECAIVENLPGIRWTKLIQNATLSGMSAALGSTYAEILDNDKATTCAAHVGNEIVKIVRKRGIQLEDIVPGWSYYCLGFDDKEGLEKLKASMLQDMEKGIKCEINQINGVACEWGIKLDIPTPANDTIVKIVKAFEAGEIPFPTMKCLDMFELPEL